MQIVIVIVIFIVISMAERIFGGSLSRTIQEKKDKVTAGMIWKSILMLGISIAALVGFIYVGVEKLSKTEMGEYVLYLLFIPLFATMFFFFNSIILIVRASSMKKIEKEKELGTSPEQNLMKKKKLMDSALFEGHEVRYLLNLEAAENFRQMGNKAVYERTVEAFTMYFEENLILNNYKREPRTISYYELATCKREKKFKFIPGRGMAKIRLSDGSKWWLYVSCYDREGDNEMQTRALWKHINEHCGMEVMEQKDLEKMLVYF